jgi:hypothetical protein
MLYGGGERAANFLIKTFARMTAKQQEAILLEAFFDPKVYQTLVNAGTYGPDNALVKHQLRLHLYNLSELHNDADVGNNTSFSLLDLISPSSAYAKEPYKEPSNVIEKNGKIYLYGIEETEAVLEQALNRIDAKRKKNRDAIEGMSGDEKRFAQSMADLTEGMHAETYRVGKEILNRRRSKK